MMDDDWTCPHCGVEEHDTKELVPVPENDDYDFEPELELTVTCQSVYIMPIDGGSGFAFNHNEFERIVEFFENSEYHNS